MQPALFDMSPHHQPLTITKHAHNTRAMHVQDINEMVKSAAGFIDGTRSVSRLPEMDRWIIDALRKHAPQVKGKTVAMWGSMSPWYEAIAVAAGAARVTTIEYNKLTYEHPLMEQVTPRNLEAKLPSGGFDVAMSISSFDHDGLGRSVAPIACRYTSESVALFER